MGVTPALDSRLIQSVASGFQTQAALQKPIAAVTDQKLRWRGYTLSGLRKLSPGYESSLGKTAIAGLRENPRCQPGYR